MNPKSLSKKARAYALKNAVAYDGKAQQGAVISALFNEGLKKDEVKKYVKAISKIISDVNKLSLEEQKEEFEKFEKDVSHREGREGLEELPGVKPRSGSLKLRNAGRKGKVVMRFRPSPSGPLHIGHIISNMASSLYIKKYGGKFYVIIDDTDPETTLSEAYKNIPKDCDWIFGNVYKYLNASDRILLYYSYAEKLIRKNSAYVCSCSGDKFREYSERMENCPCRNNEMKENIYRWNKMLKDAKEEEFVLRFKSDMQNKNPAMRDFPLARINLTPHPLQKKKYRVWPLMNLAVTVDDIELKMTHIIRGKDHRDNAERQKMIYKVLGKKFPWTFFIGRFKFTDLILSKRKITKAIQRGEYSGADDVRLPTIASLKKRGYKPEDFAQFIEQRGLNQVDKVMSSNEFFEIIDKAKK